MKRGWIWVIVAGVALAHGAVFWAVSGWDPLPKVRWTPPPNFSLGWAKFKDPATRAPMVYEEFTVSTQLEGKPARKAGE